MSIKKTFNESVRVKCENYVLKEQIDEATKEVKGVFIEGLAITFGKPTRNRVSYTYTSGTQTYKGLIGKPFLDTHHDDSVRNHAPFGHVVDCWIANNEKNTPCLYYKVDIDPEEKTFIRKARRGDIGSVSIQVLVDEVTDKNDMNGQFLEANIREFLELSAVTIPGDGDTSIRIVESFRGNKKEDVTTSNGTALITPDGVFSKRKVMKGEEATLAVDADPTKDDDKTQGPLKPLTPPLKDSQAEQKMVKPVPPEMPNDDEPETKRFKGSKICTENAMYGLRCQYCGFQVLKDVYNEGFSLRCWKCPREFFGNSKRCESYVTKAKERIKLKEVRK